MLFKRIFGVACAAVVSLGCLTVTAAADEAEEDEASHIEFTSSESFLTKDMEPALSFDNDNWKNFVFKTRDADSIGVSMTQDKTTSYQGYSLEVSASGADSSKAFMNTADAEEGALCPGIELRAESFGLSCFDGCMIMFNYKMGSDVENKLVDNNVLAFGTDEEYSASLTSQPVKLTYDVLLNDNVTQYRSESVGVPTSPQGGSVTKIVFEFPITQKLDSDVICLDNIFIQLPDGEHYIKNQDGYNPNAEKKETIEGIQIKEKVESKNISTSETKETSSSKKGVVIVIVIIAVLIAGVVVFFVIKHKTKYY